MAAVDFQEREHSTRVWTLGDTYNKARPWMVAASPRHGNTDNPAAGQALRPRPVAGAFLLQRSGILVAKSLEPLLTEEEMVTALSLGSASCDLGMSSD